MSGLRGAQANDQCSKCGAEPRSGKSSMGNACLAGEPIPGVLTYNACTEPCDMYAGPCACGAWHRSEVSTRLGRLVPLSEIQGSPVPEGNRP